MEYCLVHFIAAFSEHFSTLVKIYVRHFIQYAMYYNAALLKGSHSHNRIAFLYTDQNCNLVSFHYLH